MFCFFSLVSLVFVWVSFCLICCFCVLFSVLVVGLVWFGFHFGLRLFYFTMGFRFAFFYDFGFVCLIFVVSYFVYTYEFVLVLWLYSLYDSFLAP